MTLAAILLVGMSSSLSTQPLAAKPYQTLTAQNQETAPAPAQSQPAQTSSGQTPAQTQAPSSATNPAPAPPAHPHPSTATRPHHRKRVRPANCGALPTGTGHATSAPAPAAGDPAAAPASAADGSTPSTNCPPPKVIVRQGGTSEPSIQLAGPPAPAQASNQGATANQMLDTTEANLKKIAGKQLSANEQDMVSQTRQFMAQSKAALDAGDLERARTLAWKARLLSEELVKPEQ